MCNNEKVIGIVMIYFGIANATHCHPNKFALPKAFQTIRDANRLAFLMLLRSIKRACFAASH
jgi:hypothetical protein